MKNKTVYMLLVVFYRVLLSFLVYAEIPFKCLQNELRSVFFLFLCRISSFQNQNTLKHNFDLIINDNHMFNSKMKVGTYLEQTQATMW